MDNFEENLINISNLKDGWYNGEGKACDKAKLEEFLQTFLTYYKAALPLPLTFPDVESGIQFEWVNTEFDISLTINIDELKGYFHSLQREHDTSIEKDLDLNEKESWDFINNYIEENFTAKTI